MNSDIDPCSNDYSLTNKLQNCETYEDIKNWKIEVNNYFNNLVTRHNINENRFNSCDSKKYLNMLNIYETGIRVQVVNEPYENQDAYNKFTEEQKNSLNQIKLNFTANKQELERENSDLQRQIQEQETKSETIKQHYSEIAKLKQTIASQTSFNCYKKGDTWKDGWDKKTLEIIDEESQRKISWTGRQGQNKDLVLDANTEMHVVINRKNDKGKSIMTLHLKADPVNPNDLFYLYARVSGALESLSNTTGAGGGKKISQYKKTKNRKFNSLSNKSRTKKKKKSKKNNKN